ncbi:PREDICTED: uncharacterized protein LOC105459542 isoform X2 [Wasmannia auropunctata]|uniref:uncharacterized protein LOC105459542 isoform X2 n=1 Tax=Wasmannia auropunctata TaxID=64793 RepID=UPI0005EDD97C|nr:PREDICTED: uncharacterized protein LOC105459542 isoform X2 [Wasmannia auropunctata]
MFETDDFWIFEDSFDDVGGNKDETRNKSHSSSQNKEKIPSVKRRKVDCCEDALPTKNTSRERRNFNLVNKVEKDSSEVQRETRECFQFEVDATSKKVCQYKEPREKSHESVINVRPDKEVKLIRIFPGPAGLVPDVKNDNVSAASYLSSVEVLENKTSSKRIEIKTQDEKNLCGEKAWKLLFNDLPHNFLRDYKISIVKDKANASHCNSMKVRFIAGVLDYVDHSHDNPFVILKDSTGSIEGTIHRDIPSTYPGILEPNVVILLYDVGLLKTTTYVVTNKYHILVSLMNLLAIYSDKGRIVSTSLMESILSHISNHTELNRINNCMPVSKEPVYVSELQKVDESRDALLQTNSFIDSSTKNYESELVRNPPLKVLTSGKYESCEETFKNNDQNCKVTNEIFECFNYSMDGDDFFTTDCDFTTLEKQNCLNRSLSNSIPQTSKIQQCDLKNTKKESTINIQKQTKEHLPKTLEKCIREMCDTRYSREDCFSSYDDTTICRDSNLNMKSTLPAIKCNVKNLKPLVSHFTHDKHEYDSDDEILSQLDVDNIFDKQKKDC